MIVRAQGGGALLIRQTDHAQLSGAFAEQWAWPYAQRPSTVVAAHRHDDGWYRFQLSPALDEQGEPIDFLHINVPDHVALYRYGIDLLEIEDPYAALIASMHGERLYTRPFTADGPARLEYLSGRDRELAEEYVAYEHQRQAMLAETAIQVAGGPLVTGDLVADAEESWRLLQVWDRLSLHVCVNGLGPDHSTHLPLITGPDGQDVAIRASGTADGALELDPYPFEDADYEFEFLTRELPDRKWPSEAAFRQAYRSARQKLVKFKTRPA